MKILLLNPPSSLDGKFVSREQCGIGLVEERFLPSEILLSAAYLETLGHDVEFVDAGDDSLSLSSYEGVVVWVSVLHTFHEDVEWLRRAKESGCRTVLVLNEPYGNFEAETLSRFPFIDAAVRLWERERSLGELLLAWGEGAEPKAAGLIVRENGGLRDTGLQPALGDLSHLPSCAPLLRRLSLDGYEAAGITPGRGCSALCGFCLYAGCAQRKRRMEDVIDEVEAVAGRVNLLYFLDPDFLSTAAWTEDFCREIIRRKLAIRWRSDLRPQDADPRRLDLLRASGCEHVLIAVETLDDEIRGEVRAGISSEGLRTVVRDVRKAGIRPNLYFYVGLPWDTPDSLQKIEQFVRSEAVASFFLKQLRPWPGTLVHDACQSLGLLERKVTIDDFVHSDQPLCPTKALSIAELGAWKRRIGRAGILQPGYLWRFLRERRLTARHVGQFLQLVAGRNIFQK